ncbi:MAG TPA: DUF2339 domain-containing protein, partial [Gammaproteobacteria bacterium]
LEAFAAIAAWAGWLLLGSAEVFEHAGGDSARAPGLVYAAAITVILERAAHRFVPKARVLAVSVLPLLYAYGVWWIAETDHLLADYGWLAWPLAFAALAWTVHVLQQYRRWMLTGACWLTAAALAIEMNYGVDEWLALSHDWASAAVLMSLFGFVRFARRQLGQRYPESFDLVFALGPVVAAALLYAVSWTLTESGNFAPLPYLPVLNVMLLTSAAILWLAWQFPWGIVARRDMLIAVAVLGLLFVTMEIARGTHHLAGVRFASEALWRSGVFQASLSIIWSMLGIAGMVFGARRMQRLPWLAGAGLMGVVVVKLFLVDLGNTGSVTRIVSFIGVGLLLLVVGYLAPAPTRTGDRLQESADG